MDFRIAVGLGYLLVVNLRKPVVGRDGSAVAQDEAAHRIGHGGILLDPPVGGLYIAVHQLLVVQHGGVHIADFLPLLAVENIGLGHVVVARLDEHRLHTVLDILHLDSVVFNFGFKVGRDLKGQQIDDAGVILLLLGLEGLGDGPADFADIKFGHRAVPLDYMVHPVSPLLPLKLRFLSKYRHME